MMNSSKNINNLIIFDLDGVLIDSRINMKNSWNMVKKQYSLSQNFEEYYKHLGLPFEKILKKIGIKDKALIKKIKFNYEMNSIKNISKVKFYPRVKSTLKFLIKKKYKLSIVTSKNLKRTKLILKDLYYYFDTVNTPDLKIKSKPYPDQILYAIKKSKSSITKSIFIGDSFHDMIAAKKSGIKFYYAAYGYGDLEYNYKLNKFSEIRNIV